MQLIEQAVKELKTSQKTIKYVEKRLSSFDGTDIKTKKAMQLLIEASIFGVLYIVYCYYVFHGELWYLDVLIFISTILFIYNYLDIRIEWIKKKAIKDVPKTIRKLRYYLIGTQNLEKALELTEKAVPDSTKPFITRLKEAVESEDYIKNIEKMKNSTKSEWMKIICTLIRGYKENGDEQKAITNNLKKTTRNIEFINLQQGLDNSALLGFQIMLFFLPLIGIPGIQLFNRQLLNAFDQIQLMGSLETKIMAGKIILVSNIFTLLLSWARKNS